MQLRSNLSRAYDDIKANLEHIIMLKYKQTPAVYRRIFNVSTTDKSMIYHDSFTGLGLMSLKEEGAAGATDIIYEEYSKQYKPYTYSLLIEFSEEAMEDDRLGVIKKATAALGISAAATEDVLAANILNNAFATTGPDGKVLCATDHPLKDGTTAKNRPTNGMDFSQTSLGLAMVDWHDEQKDARGQKLTIDPKNLVYPAAIWVDVAEVLGSPDRPDTANRAINVMKSELNLQPIMWKRLTDTDAWFLLAAQGVHELNIIVRKPFHTTHGTDDKVGKVWTRGRFRRDQGFSDWRGVYASPGQ